MEILRGFVPATQPYDVTDVNIYRHEQLNIQIKQMKCKCKICRCNNLRKFVFDAEIKPVPGYGTGFCIDAVYGEFEMLTYFIRTSFFVAVKSPAFN